MTKKITSAIVIGATGLIGKKLVQRLNGLDSCEKITVVVRKEERSFKDLSKVEQLILSDFLLLNQNHIQGYSHAFSCLGSTIKKAGSKQNFLDIDYKINTHFADLFIHSSTHFLIVSAEGADENSLFFYNKVKGQVENHILNLALAQISIIRPSLLLGEREESRPLEDFSQKIFKSISHFLPDSFKYKPVTADQVAQTLVEVAQQQSEKKRIYDNLAIQKQTKEGN